MEALSRDSCFDLRHLAPQWYRLELCGKEAEARQVASLFPARFRAQSHLE